MCKQQSKLDPVGLEQEKGTKTSNGSRSRRLKVLTIGLTFLAIVVGRLLQPVPYRYVVRQEDGQLVETDESTEGARILLGSSSHIVPLVRVINELGDPIKRWLVPLDADVMKEKAVAWIGHDDFGDLADWEAFDRLAQVANKRCHFGFDVNMLTD